MKVHLAGNNPYPGVILIRLYENALSKRIRNTEGGGIKYLHF